MSTAGPTPFVCVTYHAKCANACCKELKLGKESLGRSAGRLVARLGIFCMHSTIAELNSSNDFLVGPIKVVVAAYKKSFVNATFGIIHAQIALLAKILQHSTANFTIMRFDSHQQQQQQRWRQLATGNLATW